MAGTAEASNAESLAAKLAEQHATHKVTVEDVPDQDDLEHPPPAAASSNAPQSNGSNGTFSAKAAGKQKEQYGGLNPHDEEAFPSLGGPSKAAASAPGWGAKGTFRNAASPALSESGRSTPTGTGRSSAFNLPNSNRDHFEILKEDVNKNAKIEKVLADAKRKYRVNSGMQEIAGGKKLRFYAEGPQQREVRQALLDISKSVSTQKERKIEIPGSVSSIVIGKAGANIKKWEQQHGVRINITRDPRPASNDPSDPRIDVVEIKGDAASVGEVQFKIEDMVRKNAPKITLPLKNIAPEYYPFLAGRHADDMQKLREDKDLNIRIPQYHTWQQQPPQRTSENGRSAFQPRGDSHIMLSGDGEAVKQARATVEALIRQLEEELILEELTCEQVLHPYIVGERGMDPVEFLRQSGCAIILPPGHEESDDIHIVGPADRIDDGRNLAEQLMAQKFNRPLDLSKQYTNAPMGAERHSRALAQYLQQKALEREFLKSHASEIVFPVHANGSASWSVISSDQQKAVSAKNDLMKIVQAFPTSRINLVEMDPFYHQHIGNLYTQQIRDDHGVVMIVPESSGEPIILVYEGPSQSTPFTIPRQRPTSPEQQEFEKALKAAQEFLLGAIPSAEVSSSHVPVPRKHHDRVRRFVRDQQSGTEAQFPIQFDYAGNRAGNAEERDRVSMRGPHAAEIAAMQKEIEKFLLEVEQDEKERDYVTHCDFPEKFVKNLVGKNGAHINMLREKHDVEIDTRDTGKVKIQGPQKKADACKAEIIKLGKQFEDEVTYSIQVDQKFHGELIGKNGENLKKLQAKVNDDVKIDFPRAAKPSRGSDSGSEVGGQRQSPNEIRIRGPKAKADKVRDELLSLTQYLQDNSHSATVSIHKDQVRSLIGRQGVELDRLRAETGATIDVPNNKGESDRVTVTITGTKSSVDKAAKEIGSRAKTFDSIVTKTLDVDRKHHRDLIGSKGANIQKIVTTAGGPERSAEAVQFPKQGDESTTLSVRGTQDVVDKIVAAITSFVEERENQVTEIVDVPTDQHRLLIGSGGNIRKSIEQKFGISMNVPNRESGKTDVKIAGRPEAVAQAKAHIISLTKQPEGTTVMVPKSLHHAIANEGRFFRDLSRQGIKVDHKGQQPPKRATGQENSTRRTNPASAPLITDDPNDAASFSFEVIPLGGGSAEQTGEIPWVLIGNKDVTIDAIAKAEKQIQDAINNAQQEKYIGYLRLADPKYHRYIIGSRGATINSIRKQTGCDIQVPGGAKSQNDTEEVTIVGTEDMVELAKDLIMQEVDKATE